MNSDRRTRLTIALEIMQKVRAEELLSLDRLPDTLEDSGQGDEMKRNLCELSDAALNINRVIER